MAYTKTTWVEGGAPGISAANLNKIEQGISDAHVKADASAPLNSPALTGTPTAPTAAAGTNTTQIATTAYAKAQDQRTATFVVAASNSTAAGKAAADYVCTGTNDQTTINNAITALGANGGKVVLLEGLFTIAASINITSNVSLEGQGNGTVLRIPDANNTTMDVIKNADTTNGNSGISVSNLKIDGNKANNTSGTQQGIYFIKAIYSTIQNVTVVNMRTHGIRLTTTNASGYNTVIGNVCQGNNLFGIHLINTNNNTVIGNVCQGNIQHGITLDGANNNTVIGNVCQGNTQFGVLLTNLNGSPTGNTVTGNICQGNTQRGIALGGSNNNTVTGNTCRGNGTDGIYLGSSIGNTISGNTCLENSQTANATSDNILLAGTSNTNTVQGNTCRQGALTNKPRYGIRIDASTCTGNQVTNNDLTTGGATGAFSDVGTGTITTAGNKLA